MPSPGLSFSRAELIPLGQFPLILSVDRWKSGNHYRWARTPFLRRRPWATGAVSRRIRRVASGPRIEALFVCRRRTIPKCGGMTLSRLRRPCSRPRRPDSFHLPSLLVRELAARSSPRVNARPWLVGSDYHNSKSKSRKRLTPRFGAR
jgi:hypothetical protein